MENKGTGVSTNFVVEDNIKDIVEVAELQDFNTATFDFGNYILRWPAQDIAAGAKIEKTFTVKVRKNFPNNSDFVMTNVYGNTVNVNVQKPMVAPATGSATNISLLLAFATVASAVIYRKRELLAKLVAVVR